MVSAIDCVINNSPLSQTQESPIFCQHQDLDHLAEDVVGLVEDLGLITRHAVYIRHLRTREMEEG